MSKFELLTTSSSVNALLQQLVTITCQTVNFSNMSWLLYLTPEYFFANQTKLGFQMKCWYTGNDREIDAWRVRDGQSHVCLGKGGGLALLHLLRWQWRVTFAAILRLRDRDVQKPNNGFWWLLRHAALKVRWSHISPDIEFEPKWPVLSKKISFLQNTQESSSASKTTWQLFLIDHALWSRLKEMHITCTMNVDKALHSASSNKTIIGADDTYYLVLLCSKAMPNWYSMIWRIGAAVWIKCYFKPVVQRSWLHHPIFKSKQCLLRLQQPISTPLRSTCRSKIGW